MADIIKCILLGVVEGLTEFIPISSTGHLILFGHWLHLDQVNENTFDIAIQLGAILAVVVYYKSFFLEFFHIKHWFSQTMAKIIVAILPVMIIAFFLYPFIKEYLFSPHTVLIGLVIGALLMIVVERMIRIPVTTTSFEAITYKQSFLIGIFQCLSLWPGMSRSASTIVGGLVGKLNHETAAQFSFIIAVPVMCAAVFYELLKSFSSLTSFDFLCIGVGFIVSFIVALFSIAFFFKILKSLKLLPFAIYRLVISAILALILYL